MRDLNNVSSSTREHADIAQDHARGSDCPRDYAPIVLVACLVFVLCAIMVVAP